MNGPHNAYTEANKSEIYTQDTFRTYYDQSFCREYDGPGQGIGDHGRGNSSKIYQSKGRSRQDQSGKNACSSRTGATEWNAGTADDKGTTLLFHDRNGGKRRITLGGL